MHTFSKVAEAGSGCGDGADGVLLACEATPWLLRELGVDDVRVFLPFVLLYPHLQYVSVCNVHREVPAELTFLNVLRPARMLPPVHVVYMRSGGANILILMSFTASRCTSWSNRLPNPFVNVEPPDSTMLP